MRSASQTNAAMAKSSVPTSRRGRRWLHGTGDGVGGWSAKGEAGWAAVRAGEGQAELDAQAAAEVRNG